MSEVKAKVLLNIGYMVRNLELDNQIEDSCIGELTDFILATIDDFIRYDKRMTEQGFDDFYGNMENYYKNKLVDLFSK